MYYNYEESFVYKSEKIESSSWFPGSVIPGSSHSTKRTPHWLNLTTIVGFGRWCVFVCGLSVSGAWAIYEMYEYVGKRMKQGGKGLCVSLCSEVVWDVLSNLESCAFALLVWWWCVKYWWGRFFCVCPVSWMWICFLYIVTFVNLWSSGNYCNVYEVVCG